MKISHQRLDTGIILIHLEGRLDAITKDLVKETFQDFLTKNDVKLVIDLEQVPFIDSSGLAALVSGLRTSRENGGNIALSGIQPQAQTVFRLTMLDRVFSVHPTYQQAEQSLL